MSFSGPQKDRIPPKGSIADGDVVGAFADGRTLDAAVDVQGDFLDPAANVRHADRLRRDKEFHQAHTGDLDYASQEALYNSIGANSGPFTGDRAGKAKGGTQAGRDTGSADSFGDSDLNTGTDR
jgi:hypothetical protein